MLPAMCAFVPAVPRLPRDAAEHLPGGVSAGRGGGAAGTAGAAADTVPPGARWVGVAAVLMMTNDGVGWLADWLAGGQVAINAPRAAGQGCWSTSSCTNSMRT